jgi:hypothetical protein
MTRSLLVATASPTNHNSHPAAAAGSAVAQHAAHHPYRSRRRRARHRYRLLTLGITGLASPDPELIRAGYLAMGLLADAVLLPPALPAPITGILLALGTRWGLARHWWVTVKLVLTIGLATAAVFVLRTALNPRRSSGAVGAHGRVARHRNRTHRHRGDPGAVGRAAGACYHRDPGGLQTLGPDPIPTPLTAAISCFVTLRRGRQLVYERNMIDELALKLVHGSYR